MAFQLVQGTIEIVPVTIRDLTGVITTLDGTTPTFSINYVDPTTDEDSTAQVSGASCVNSGLMLQPLVDTTTDNNVGLVNAFVKAANAPTLPLTVVTSVNDTFKAYSGSDFVLAPGTYTNITDLIDAVKAALFGGVNPWDPDYVTVTNSGGKLLFTSVGTGATDNGVTLNIGTNDVLISLGFTDGQQLAGGVDAGGVWPRAKYRLYVSFTVGDGEVPIEGPFEFYIV